MLQYCAIPLKKTEEMAGGGRQIEPMTGAVLPRSEAKTVDERRASLASACSNGAASDSTRHPFQEKGPWRQGCETLFASSLLPSLVLALLFFGAVAVCVLYLRARIQQQPVAIAQVRAIAPATSEETPALPVNVVSVVDAPAAGIAPNELGTVVSVEQPPANQR